ncbi:MULTISPECIES: ribosomal protein S18-alanine N-acetyltransferase [Microbacterium]|uniref:ribosomal protein S18-alanine N-acetyltransferase n=1 Tax=Microbacterium TaxID=33882 RepID=UPI00217DBDC8|nr:MULTISPECIES: ribosomal protein S18-alanine N-acetyltransferase [Microbacterium]
MTLRTATIDDLDAIMRIERRSFPTDAWSEDTMATELTSAHNHYLVDEEDGVVIGYGGLRALRGAADADIQTIAFDAEHRGAGRGRALLRALLAEAAERGAREVFLEVRADNPGAEGLYLSEGFAELARRPRYYQPDDVDAIVMKLDLRAWAARAREGTTVTGADPAVPAGTVDRAVAAGTVDPAGTVDAAGHAVPARAREENSRSGGTIRQDSPPEGENSSRADEVPVDRSPAGTVPADGNPAGTVAADRNPAGTVAADRNPAGTVAAGTSDGGTSREEATA